MFPLPIRIAVVLLAAVYGGYQLANGERSGSVWLFASVVVAFGYFRYGAIRPAFMALRRGNLELARKHLETIRFPQFLSAESRAYFHWIQGVLAAQDPHSLQYAEEQMQLAIAGKIRISHDRCLAVATLAEIVAQNGDPIRAGQLLAQAKQIPHRPSADAWLETLRKALEVSPQQDSPVTAD